MERKRRKLGKCVCLHLAGLAGNRYRAEVGKRAQMRQEPLLCGVWSVARMGGFGDHLVSVKTSVDREKWKKKWGHLGRHLFSVTKAEYKAEYGAGVLRKIVKAWERQDAEEESSTLFTALGAQKKLKILTSEYLGIPSNSRMGETQRKQHLSWSRIGFLQGGRFRY